MLNIKRKSSKYLTNRIIQTKGKWFLYVFYENDLYTYCTNNSFHNVLLKVRLLGYHANKIVSEEHICTEKFRY